MHIVSLANNLLGYVEGDSEFMSIKELHSGYNRMYQLEDKSGSLSRPLAMNEMADFVDGIATIAGKIRNAKT